MLAEASPEARCGAFSELQSLLDGPRRRTIPRGARPHLILQVDAPEHVKKRGEQAIEDMDSSGAAGDFDCGAGRAAGIVDVLRRATGRPGKTRAGATARGGPEAAHRTAAAAASGGAAGASAPGLHSGAIERGKYRCSGDGSKRRHHHRPAEAEFSGLG